MIDLSMTDLLGDQVVNEYGLVPQRPLPASIEVSPPFCEKCQRIVEQTGVQYGTERIEAPDDVRFVHTGEIILSVQCHGEQWEYSNWREIHLADRRQA